MNPSRVVIASALIVLGLTACEKTTVVPPTTVVTVPGPAGPSGAPGATGITGTTGNTGATGGDTVIVVPSTAPAPTR